MANIHYQGVTLKVEGTLQDVNKNPVQFVDTTEISIDIFDIFSKKFTKTKSGGSVLAGSSATSYAFELSAAETSKLRAGKVDMRIEISYPSLDVTGDAVFREVYELTKIKEWD